MDYRRDRKRARRSLHLLVALAACIGAATPLVAQDIPDGIQTLCAELAEGARLSCIRASVGVESARAALGLAATGGPSLSASSSTLGKRIRSVPRIAFALRGGLTRGNLPSLSSDGGEGNRWLRSVRASAAVNLLQGFSLAPTVGGVLSADVFGDVGLVSPTGSDAFGDGVTSGGIGLRVGVFRESFSMPGVTVSAARRWIGSATFGVPDGEGAEFDNEVTSLRAVVGKDVAAFGLLSGVGWERYSGDATIRYDTGADPPSVTAVQADGLESDRLIIFGGIAYSSLVWRFAFEGGWGGGTGESDGIPGFDADKGSLFGALAIRLLL